MPTSKDDTYSSAFSQMLFKDENGNTEFIDVALNKF